MCLALLLQRGPSGPFPMAFPEPGFKATAGTTFTKWYSKGWQVWAGMRAMGIGEESCSNSLSLWPVLFHLGNKASLSVMEAWAPEDDISCGESSLQAAALEDSAPSSARKTHWPGEGACPGHTRGTGEE